MILYLGFSAVGLVLSKLSIRPAAGVSNCLNTAGLTERLITVIYLRRGLNVALVLSLVSNGCEGKIQKGFMKWLLEKLA